MLSECEEPNMNMIANNKETKNDNAHLAEQWQLRIDKDDSYRRDLNLLFKELRSQAISNVEYFQDATGPNHERFFAAFHTLYEHLDLGIEPGVEHLISLGHMYDIGPDIPANGYRSIVKVIHKCCLHLLQVARYVSVNRGSFTFRGSHYSKEVEAYVTTLGQLRACLYYLQKLIKYCGQGELFPGNLEPDDQMFAENMLLEVEALCQEPFYGRCLGFQYCNSMVKPLTTINVAMASFSEGYFQTDSSTMMKVASSVLGGSKYILDSEKRAEKVVNVTRTGDVRFCKAFWSLAESNLMHSLPLFVCPPVQVDKVILIPPESFEVAKKDGGVTSISVPCAHSGPGPVSTRLISYHLRHGQEIWKTLKESKISPTKIQPLSRGLIIHFHGGGFVAQSSASHEVYLRHWAKETEVPMLSVDYSLAPEHPFPRQLEECFFAYAWAVKNCHKLGSTGERICVAGDSAGGNLAVTVALRAIANGVRAPDGIMSSYGCMLIQYLPSPSRLLSLMDPLLPMGILSQCLSAYAGVAEEESPLFNPNDLTRKSPQPGTSTSQDQNAHSSTASTSAAPTSFHIGAGNMKPAETTDSTSFLQDSGINPRTYKEKTKKPLTLDLTRSTSTGELIKRSHVRSPSSPTFTTSPMSRRDPSLPPTTPTYAKVRHFAQSPVLQFRRMPLAKNPFMSPYHAPDSLLGQLPPIYLVACKLDPMLDDSIMFAKRLQGLGIEVHVDALEDLPHGFLNFVLVSQDAWNGSEVCVARLKEILALNEDTPVFPDLS